MGLFDNAAPSAPGPAPAPAPGFLGLLGGLGNPQRTRQAILPDDVKRRLDLADALAQKGSDSSPIASPFQGLARMADVLAGNQTRSQALQDRQGAIDAANASFANLGRAFGQGAGAATPAPGPGPQADAGTTPSGNPMANALANYQPGGDGSAGSSPATGAMYGRALAGDSATSPVNPYAVALNPALAQSSSSTPDAAPGTADGSGNPSPSDVTSYITQAAQARGIAPSAALTVAQAESGLDPAAIGDNGSSNGLFQLHSGGVAPGGNAVAGMGDDFRQATGLDPADPSTWRQQVDFALDRAKTGGWTPWHAAAAAGLGPMDGIGGTPAGPQMPQGSAGSGQPVQQAYAAAQGVPSSSSPALGAIQAAAPTSIRGDNSVAPGIGQPVDNPYRGITSSTISPSSVQSGSSVSPSAGVTSFPTPASSGPPGGTQVAMNGTGPSPSPSPQPGGVAPIGSQPAASAGGLGYGQLSDGSIYSRDAAGNMKIVQQGASGAQGDQGSSGTGAPIQMAANGSQPSPGASSGTMPYTTGNAAGGAPGAARPAIDPSALLAVMTNPWASPMQQQIATQMYQQQAQRGRFVQYRDGDGSLWSQDSFGLEPPKLLQDNHPKSPDIEGFRAARSTGFTGSFDDYILGVKKATAPLTTTNIDQRGESAESAKSGEFAATRRNDMLIAADKAPENISRLQLLNKVLADTQTGPLAGEKGKVAAVAGTLGISPDTIKGWGLDPNQPVNNEIAQKLSNELVAGSIGAKGGGFPASNFSVAERQFIEKMFPSIASQQGSNQAVSDVLIAREQRNLDKADAWQGYKNQQRATGKPLSYEDFEGDWQQGHSRDNIFAPIMQKFQAGGYAPAGATLPTPTPYGSFGNQNTPQATGQRELSIAAARDAIAKGVPRDAVLQRLQKSGIDTSGSGL